jgi:hypothetical protein
METVELLKQEALRLAIIVLCQGATAGKGTDKPTPSVVLDAAKMFYSWFAEK